MRTLRHMTRGSADAAAAPSRPLGTLGGQAIDQADYYQS